MMKNVDAKKLELEMVKRMLELGAEEICPELAQRFADETRASVRLPHKNSQTSQAERV